MLVVVVASFLYWASWVANVRLKQLNRYGFLKPDLSYEDPGSKGRRRVLPEPESPMVSETSSKLSGISSRTAGEYTFRDSICHDVRSEVSIKELREEGTPMIEARLGDDTRVESTWDHTLNSLWEAEDAEHKCQKGWLGHAMPHSILEDDLVGTNVEDAVLRSKDFEQLQRKTSRERLLNEVLQELPTSTPSPKGEETLTHKGVRAFDDNEDCWNLNDENVRALLVSLEGSERSGYSSVKREDSVEQLLKMDMEVDEIMANITAHTQKPAPKAGRASSGEVQNAATVSKVLLGAEFAREVHHSHDGIIEPSLLAETQCLPQGDVLKGYSARLSTGSTEYVPHQHSPEDSADFQQDDVLDIVAEDDAEQSPGFLSTREATHFEAVSYDCESPEQTCSELLAFAEADSDGFLDTFDVQHCCGDTFDIEVLEPGNGPDGLAAAAELERSMLEDAQREVETRIAVEAALRAAEGSKRQAEARAAAEEAARAAARSASIDQASAALMAAVASRSREEIEDQLQDAKEKGVSEDLLNDATKVINEIIDEENRIAALHCLDFACQGGNIDELRLAIGRAKETGVDDDQVQFGMARLDDLISKRARREAATKRLRDLMNVPPANHCTLRDYISNLQIALEAGRVAMVPASELVAADERLVGLMAQRRCEDAKRAMTEALAAHSPEQVKAALSEARAAHVDRVVIERVEQSLQGLLEEIELANDKEKLLLRRISNAIQAKADAERAEKATDVEKFLGEGSVIAALNKAISDAKKTRLVRRAEIVKAEAVLPEVTADLKRILHEKQQHEQRIAAQKLLQEVAVAQRTKPTTHLVLEVLRSAIVAAQIYRAETKDAEVLLGALSLELERTTQAAQDAVDHAIQTKDIQRLTASIEQLRALLLDDAITRSLAQIRGVVTEDIAKAHDQDRENRLHIISSCEAFLGILRANGDEQLRKIHNDLQDLKGALRVFCRIRPPNTKERERNDELSVEILDQFSVAVQNSHGDRHMFSYDAIFGPTSTQSDVFNECRSLVQSSLDGYNVTIFTYGQTGAGKTWTLYGTGQELGISPRTCREVFVMIAREQQRFSVDVHASMVELYLSDLRDLLSRSKEPAKLELRNVRQPDGSTTVRLDGATRMLVNGSEDLAHVVAMGLGNRKTRSTDMNADSSRSHLLLMLTLDITDRASGRTRSGKITIVDLAGSERLAKSGAVGESQREAIEINKSLSALGDVMMAFTSNAKMIPYRNHKLTQLMQDSLGGSAKTLMFVNISPSMWNSDESISALKYAARARCIENDTKGDRGRAGHTSVAATQHLKPVSAAPGTNGHVQGSQDNERGDISLHGNQGPRGRQPRAAPRGR